MNFAIHTFAGQKSGVYTSYKMLDGTPTLNVTYRSGCLDVSCSTIKSALLGL